MDKYRNTSQALRDTGADGPGVVGAVEAGNHVIEEKVCKVARRYTYLAI